jgi:hypothetical protein
MARDLTSVGAATAAVVAAAAAGFLFFFELLRLEQWIVC